MEYSKEVKARFGDTDAFCEFEKKTSDYTEEKWQSTESGMDDILMKFAQCKNSGCTPDCEDAKALAKELQDYITQNYYTCTDAIFKGLGAMYVADERFKENIDKHGEGTAEFISKAITVYCKG